MSASRAAAASTGVRAASRPSRAAELQVAEIQVLLKPVYGALEGLLKRVEALERQSRPAIPQTAISSSEPAAPRPPVSAAVNPKRSNTHPPRRCPERVPSTAVESPGWRPLWWGPPR
jgi:hypothetical protein